MTFDNLQPETQRICRLVMDKTSRSMAGQRGFSLYLVGSVPLLRLCRVASSIRCVKTWICCRLVMALTW